MNFSSYSRINEPATIERSKYMLGNYQQFHRIEKREMILLKSPSLSGMPKSGSKDNDADENIIKSVDAHAYCEVCRNTIDALENDDYRAILTMTYINPVYSKSFIYDAISVSKATFYAKTNNEALLAYAEVCPGMPDIDYVNNGKMIDLLVWNK